MIAGLAYGNNSITAMQTGLSYPAKFAREMKSMELHHQKESLESTLNYLSRDRDIDDVLSRILAIESEIRNLWHKAERQVSSI